MHGFTWGVITYSLLKVLNVGLMLDNKLSTHPQAHTLTTAPPVSYPCLTALFMISSSNKLKIYICASPGHSHKHIVTVTHTHADHLIALKALSWLSSISLHKLCGMPAHTLVFYRKTTHGHMLWIPLPAFLFFQLMSAHPLRACQDKELEWIQRNCILVLKEMVLTQD